MSALQSVIQMGTHQIPWYLAGGAPAPVAAYQPVGAPSYAASKVNVANPGTYDLYEGTAPAWDTVRGLKFSSASSQYLKSDLVPTNDQTWTMIVRVANIAVSTVKYTAGIASSYSPFPFFFIYFDVASKPVFGTGNKSLTGVSAATSGVFAFAGRNTYVDGVAGGVVAAGVAANANILYVGAANNGAGVPAGYLDGDILALAIYSYTLTPDQISAVSQRMAVLPL